LNANEIRVLQEFRRTTQQTMTLAEIRAIKHPAGSGDPVSSLIGKGFLSETEPGVSVSLTERAGSFLAYDPKPRE
jgi:hypothetical protein